jgi:hypothetical protein
MKLTQGTRYLLSVALATSSMTGMAEAQGQQPQPSQLIAQKMSSTSTVSKIDAGKRELSLKDDRGNDVIVHVPEDVTRFDAIKVGDRITVDYYESLALSLKRPSEAGTMPTPRESTTMERTAGPLPGGKMARKITGSVEVLKVDRADNKVTIKTPSGDKDTINVSDPGMRSQLGQLKKGDHIQTTYTEAMAVSITPKSK